MPRFLFTISIGPVQEFISAARRTRDFWMGSTILSECAKAIARWATDVDSSELKLDRLIFPGVDPNRARQQLQAWEFDDHGNMPEDEFSVSNVLLLEAETNDPGGFAASAKKELEKRWQEVVDRTLNRQVEDQEGHKSLVRYDLDETCLELQLACPHDFFEYFAAWVPIHPGGYEKARRDVIRLLGARKACRDFDWWQGLPLKPKSSLDAARETVLKPPEDRSLALHIRDSEQLDLVGVVKRLDFGNDSIRFPSVSRFAADPWIRGIVKSAGAEKLREIATTCERLRQLRLLRRRINFPGKPQQDDLIKHSWWEDFPFEGTPLFVNRHEELLREHPFFCAETDRDRKPHAYLRWKERENGLRAHLSQIAGLVSGLKDEYGEPQPYFAILIADGDRLGKALSIVAGLNDPEIHRAFSLAQALFADEARKLVNSPWLCESRRANHSPFHGAMVFAGADDVLAFAPLDQCVVLARHLHDLFGVALRNSMQSTGQHRAIERLDNERAFPTLSVGIAIGHFMEPLEDLLQYARIAEHRAKNPSQEDRGQTKRNALAIAVHSRGGAPFMVRDNWRDGDDAVQSIDQRVLVWADMHRRQQLPSKAAYDLSEIAREYRTTWGDEDQLAFAIQKDATRVLVRKRGSRRDEAQERIRRLRSLVGNVRTAADLLALSRELLIGQWIGDSLDQSRQPLMNELATEGKDGQV